MAGDAKEAFKSKPNKKKAFKERRQLATIVRASLTWLNYNSSRFIDVALKSIESVLNLDFDDYGVVTMDNTSTDSSFETIQEIH